MKKGLIIAGEASAEMYASFLVKELKNITPGISFSGIGGDRLQAGGVEIIAHYSELSVVGAWELFGHLNKIRNALKNVVRRIKQENPDFVILMDFPDFNFMVIKRIRKWFKGKIIYLISPQIWAWRKGRRDFLKKNADHLIVILPFEKKIYEEIGFEVEYLGHPLMDIVEPEKSSSGFREYHGFKQNSKIISIFPGSRRKEIEHHGDILRSLVEKLKTKYSEAEFCIVAAHDGLVPVLSEKFGAGRVKVIPGVHYDAINASYLVVAKSGTTTLEAAILEKPAVVFYKIEPLSFLLGKLLVNVPYVSLPNLILNGMVYPEFIQKDFNAENMYAACERFLEDTDLHITTVEKLRELKGVLGDKGFFERAALKIKGWIDG